jgi:uncharacterized damage-inducible protein DinB
MSEINRITQTLRSSFEKNAWHGPAVMEILDEVSEKNCFSRLPNTHSIIELVAHLTAWRVYTAEKLKGKHLQVSDEMNFPKPSDWKKTLEELTKTQAELLVAIQNFPEEKLDETVPHTKNRYTFYTLIHGIVHHDVYHAGQIMLIVKAQNLAD